MPKIKKIYVGTNLIRPMWKPWANTIAYYKLKSNTNDTMGTYNLTNSWITFGSLWGVVCANFNGSNTSAQWNFYSFWTTDLTASAWGYPTSNNQWVWWQIWNYTLVMNSKNWVVDWTSAPTPLNTWTNIVFTVTWGKLKIYSNGTLYLDTSFSTNVTWTLYLWKNNENGNKFSGWLSELIFEKVAWSVAQIKDYYDWTKGGYWIS